MFFIFKLWPSLIIGLLIFLFVLMPSCWGQDNLEQALKEAKNSVEVYYLYSDHLQNTTLVLDQEQKIQEIIDYNSFGSVRLDKKTNNYNEPRKFLGQYYDEASNLDYLNIRYYDGASGRFISEDPEFWADLNNNLLDPQQLNSYSYSRNNPVVYCDPNGLSSASYNKTPKNGWQIGQKMGEFNGVAAYYNGLGSLSTSFSCVEFAKRYEAQTYGINNIGSVGSAKAMWEKADIINSKLNNANSSYVFSKHVNGEGFSLPSSGDLLFSTDGQYGHVMVVTEANFNEQANKGYVEIIDQNASRQAVRVLDVKKTEKGYQVMKNANTPLAGWLSPTTNNSSNNFSPTPTNQRPMPFYQKIWNNAKQFIKKYL
jgi:RHS repeat-associated protein